MGKYHKKLIEEAKARGPREKVSTTKRLMDFVPDDSRIKLKLMQTAEKEMARGIREYVAKGRLITPDTLLEQYDASKTAQALFEREGLDRHWLVAMAKQKMKELGVVEIPDKPAVVEQKRQRRWFDGLVIFLNRLLKGRL